MIEKTRLSHERIEKLRRLTSTSDDAWAAVAEVGRRIKRSRI